MENYYLVFALTLILTILPLGRSQCFDNLRFPKIVQVNDLKEDSMSRAIVAHDTTLYSAGSITQPEWLYEELTGWAHVGRIDIPTRTWKWQKQFAEGTQSLMTTITALSVDPSGLKLACHGYSDTDDSSLKGYLFVLDTGSGALVSGLM